MSRLDDDPVVPLRGTRGEINPLQPDTGAVQIGSRGPSWGRGQGIGGLDLVFQIAGGWKIEHRSLIPYAPGQREARLFEWGHERPFQDVMRFVKTSLASRGSKSNPRTALILREEGFKIQAERQQRAV